MADTYTVTIRDINGLVDFCKRNEVQAIFRNRSDINSYRNRWNDDEDDRSNFSYKGVCIFQGIRTSFSMPFTELVPRGWQFNDVTKELTKVFERKTDARECLAELGVESDRLKELFKITASDMKEICDESNAADEERVVTTQKSQLPKFHFDGGFKYGIEKVSLQVKTEYNGSSKLKYRVVADWANQSSKLKVEVETSLKKAIPGLQIYEGSIEV